MPKYLKPFDTLYAPDPNTGCWLWTLASDKGYGWYQYDHNKRMLAHRYSHLLYKGFLTKGKVIMHLCDNPSCVNPKHLQEGTQKENRLDCVNKNRQAKQHAWVGGRVFTDADILMIRESSLTQKELASLYDCHQSQISRIKNRKSYGWV